MPFTSLKRPNSRLPAVCVETVQDKIWNLRVHGTSPLSPSTPKLFARKLDARPLVSGRHAADTTAEYCADTVVSGTRERDEDRDGES